MDTPLFVAAGVLHAARRSGNPAAGSSQTAQKSLDWRPSWWFRNHNAYIFAIGKAARFKPHRRSADAAAA
jgi:hypothetical protein